MVEGGVGGSSSADQVEITHSVDTAINSVSKSIMSAVVLASSGNDGKVETVTPPQAISSINFSGTQVVVGPQHIVDLTSTDTSSTYSQSTPLICPWDVEREKDTGFTHSTVTNNTRITVDKDGTYQVAASIRAFDAVDDRIQTVAKILINGVVQAQPYGSSYIRNSGDSSDYWSCVVNPPPKKLTAGDYVEVQIQIESQITVATTSVFQGDQSSFSVINLEGTKGPTGPTGSGANIIIQKDDVTIGTVTDTLNFEGSGVSSAVDEGSDKTTITITGGEQYYSQVTNNTTGGTVSAPYADPVIVTSASAFSLTAAITGSYLIYGTVNIGTNLNEEKDAIELMYGIDTGSGPAIGPEPYRQTQISKKNKPLGIQGTWGNVALTAGDVVHLYISTLDDSCTWVSGSIFIATWE